MLTRFRSWLLNRKEIQRYGASNADVEAAAATVLTNWTHFAMAKANRQDVPLERLISEFLPHILPIMWKRHRRVMKAKNKNLSALVITTGILYSETHDSSAVKSACYNIWNFLPVRGNPYLNSAKQ